MSGDRDEAVVQPPDPPADPDDWEAVFWDIGGVILELESVQAAHAEFVADLIERHEVALSLEEAIDIWRTTVGDYFRERDGTAFRAAREGYHRGIEAIVGEEVPMDEWKPPFQEAVQASIEPVPSAPETIARLAERDLHVGVVSDVDDREGKEILEYVGVRRHVDSITTSEEVGHTKPHPAMFETALTKADVTPERSLMIGDRYDHDVRGAARMNIHGVAFGAKEGPAVSYRIESPKEVLAIVEGDR
ncbi:HAD superfamily hydrolase [Natrialba magadii ATCC 43099]|uniref:HAD-superfamily hydrolase n=1 Tax=Natrialba magadii (strain ATCC 43099 / DSM 3394 / CCM 3739 / CIP 104546 / IAM 13178 / JCM 8861 / NBRC 102185 / NCIMB 2190 / MS3) TaxID=547559 RepID=D3SRD2_NATMM|nr:HAD family hydrolase [Natrialba magadii]ADD04637.1 HAD superfamily hydrolase [Natrialba magadii ATCC 43099]ELY25292.1 HAD-superfamily hydrolase [Natrialba magadii ATCC 43099]